MSQNASSAVDDAALEALLSEALDDFDPTPAVGAVPAGPGPSTEPTAAAASAAPASSSSSAAAAMATATVDKAEEESLARQLVDELSLAGAADQVLPAASTATRFSGAASDAAQAAAALAAANEAPDISDEMEKTIRALASSAEMLADDGKGRSDEDAMMELLRQLGTNEPGSGPGDPGAAADAEAGMIHLLQKLSAELPAEFGGPGGGMASAPSCGDGGGGGSAPSTSGGKAKAHSGAAEASAASTPPSGPSRSGDADEDAAVDGLLDSLVGQLLSKDVMHEPMKHLHEEFPRYLDTHKDRLGPDEMTRYKKQQDLVAQILAAYDRTPTDTDEVAALMQRMQACGPPPPEIAGPVADGVGCVVS